jgi:hypothetical protein
MDCYNDEDFACGVRIADEPLHGILCRRRQQRIVVRRRRKSADHPTAQPTGGDGGPEVEVKARKWLIDVPRSGGQAEPARPSRSVCEGR